MHAEKIAKAKELATNLMCHPLANSDIATVEYAGETIKELCDYCDRMRQRYEDAETAMRLDRAEAFAAGYEAGAKIANARQTSENRK